MKRIFFVFAFLISIAGAFATMNASMIPETAYYRNPDVTHCIASNEECDINQLNPCRVAGNKQGYRIDCFTLLFKP
jgi:hypothetical protein